MKSNPTVGIRTEQQLIGVNDDGAGDDECLLDDPLATSFDPPRATSARGRMVNHHCRRRRRGWLEQGEKTAKKLGCAKAERKIQIKHISRIMINNTLLAARAEKTNHRLELRPGYNLSCTHYWYHYILYTQKQHPPIPPSSRTRVLYFFLHI